MSKSQEKYDGYHTYSLIAEQTGMGRQEEDLEAALATSGWCCFGSGRSKQETRILLRRNDEIGNLKDCLLMSEMKNLKEFSEVMGGPKCKNMAKRAGAYCKWRRTRTKVECVYSPETYALNFDDGGDDDQREEKDLLVSL